MVNSTFQRYLFNHLHLNHLRCWWKMEISEPYSKYTESAVWEPSIRSTLATFIISPGHGWQEAEVNQLAESGFRFVDINLVSRPPFCPLSGLFAHFKEWSFCPGSWVILQFCPWKQGSSLTLWKNFWFPYNHPNSGLLHLLEISLCPLCPLLLCDSASKWAQFCSEPDRSCWTLQIYNPATC